MNGVVGFETPLPAVFFALARDHHEEVHPDVTAWRGIASFQVCYMGYWFQTVPSLQASRIRVWVADRVREVITAVADGPWDHGRFTEHAVYAMQSVPTTPPTTHHPSFFVSDWNRAMPGLSWGRAGDYFRPSAVADRVREAVRIVHDSDPIMSKTIYGRIWGARGCFQFARPGPGAGLMLWKRSMPDLDYVLLEPFVDWRDHIRSARAQHIGAAFSYGPFSAENVNAMIELPFEAVGRAADWHLQMPNLFVAGFVGLWIGLIDAPESSEVGEGT